MELDLNCEKVNSICMVCLLYPSNSSSFPLILPCANSRLESEQQGLGERGLPGLSPLPPLPSPTPVSQSQWHPLIIRPLAISVTRHSWQWGGIEQQNTDDTRQLRWQTVLIGNKGRRHRHIITPPPSPSCLTVGGMLDWTGKN